MASAFDGEKQRSAASSQGSQTWATCSRALKVTGAAVDTAVDATTTTQREADEDRGRAMRKEEERQRKEAKKRAKEEERRAREEAQNPRLHATCRAG